MQYNAIQYNSIQYNLILWLTLIVIGIGIMGQRGHAQAVNLVLESHPNNSNNVSTTSYIHLKSNSDIDTLMYDYNVGYDSPNDPLPMMYLLRKKDYDSIGTVNYENLTMNALPLTFSLVDSRKVRVEIPTLRYNTEYVIFVPNHESFGDKFIDNPTVSTFTTIDFPHYVLSSNTNYTPMLNCHDSVWFKLNRPVPNDSMFLSRVFCITMTHRIVDTTITGEPIFNSPNERDTSIRIPVNYAVTENGTKVSMIPVTRLTPVFPYTAFATMSVINGDSATNIERVFTYKGGYRVMINTSIQDTTGIDSAMFASLQSKHFIRYWDEEFSLSERSTIGNNRFIRWQSNIPQFNNDTNPSLSVALSCILPDTAKFTAVFERFESDTIEVVGDSGCTMSVYSPNLELLGNENTYFTLHNGYDSRIIIPELDSNHYFERWEVKCDGFVVQDSVLSQHNICLTPVGATIPWWRLIFPPNFKKKKFTIRPIVSRRTNQTRKDYALIPSLTKDTVFSKNTSLDVNTIASVSSADTWYTMANTYTVPSGTVSAAINAQYQDRYKIVAYVIGNQRVDIQPTNSYSVTQTMGRMKSGRHVVFVVQQEKVGLEVRRFRNATTSSIEHLTTEDIDYFEHNHAKVLVRGGDVLHPIGSFLNRTITINGVPFTHNSSSIYRSELYELFKGESYSLSASPEFSESEPDYSKEFTFTPGWLDQEGYLTPLAPLPLTKESFNFTADNHKVVGAQWYENFYLTNVYIRQSNGNTIDNKTIRDLALIPLVDAEILNDNSTTVHAVFNKAIDLNSVNSISGVQLFNINRMNTISFIEFKKRLWIGSEWETKATSSNFPNHFSNSKIPWVSMAEPENGKFFGLSTPEVTTGVGNVGNNVLIMNLNNTRKLQVLLGFIGSRGVSKNSPGGIKSAAGGYLIRIAGRENTFLVRTEYPKLEWSWERVLNQAVRDGYLLGNPEFTWVSSMTRSRNSGIINSLELMYPNETDEIEIPTHSAYTLNPPKMILPALQMFHKDIITGGVTAVEVDGGLEDVVSAIASIASKATEIGLKILVAKKVAAGEVAAITAPGSSIKDLGISAIGEAVKMAIKKALTNGHDLEYGNLDLRLKSAPGLMYLDEESWWGAMNSKGTLVEWYDNFMGYYLRARLR